jgi:hypothetical protein
MVELDDLAGKVFSLLKGNGLKIKIFDTNGAETTDPNQGRRFFVLEPNIMVTIDEDSNKIEFSKGADVGDSVTGIQKNIRKLADEFLMNSDIKVFGKTIQPRDYAYQAKMQKGDVMNEESEVRPHNHHLLGEVLQKVKYFGKATAGYLAANLSHPVDLSEIQPILNRLVQTGKISASPDKHNHMEYSMAVDEAVMEGMSLKQMSDFNLMLHGAMSRDEYNKKWKQGSHRPLDPKKKLDPTGVYKNLIKTMDETITESFSKMFGSLKTSQQMLENVRILVKHKTPVDENIRGSRTRHISAIFLECNGERFRFPHNYLPGARAMAQHLAHGGTMGDKVGVYISESTGNLLKLQSFNRYVTTNKLINEDSSGIVETVKENIETLRTELKKLTGVKTYETVKARLETFEREALAEDDTSGLKELFTIRRFDEKFEEVLPIVKQLVQEKNTFHKRIEEAAGNVIHISSKQINTTPMFEFASNHARLGFMLNEFSMRIVENDELAGFINKIGTKLCKEGTVNDFERAVMTQVFENLQVVEQKALAKKEIKESADLSVFYDKYTMNFF